MALTKVFPRMMKGVPTSVEDFGADPTGVSDSTTAINNALSSGATIVIGNGGTYLISGSLAVPSGVTFDGQGGTIVNSSLSTAVNTSGSFVTVKNWIIKTDVDGTQKQFYGINNGADNAVIENCYVTDTRFTAVANAGSDVKIFDVTAEDCGWDLVQNFDSVTPPARVHVHRCHAIRTGRHGFSTDTGATDVVFEDCVATDVGNPSLNEGKDAYHFEGSIRNVVKNCIATYTANHPVCSASGVNAFQAFREFASTESLIDGLTVNVDSGFSPLGSASYRSFYIDDATENFVCRGLKVFNDSSTVFNLLWSNDDYQEVYDFCDFVIQGPHSWTQLGTNSGARRISNGVFIGTGTETSINQQYLFIDSEISDVTFRNVSVGASLYGFQNSVVKGCRFEDCASKCVELDHFSFTATYRPANGAIIGNYFSGTNGTLLYSDGNNGAATFANNIVNGTASVGLAAVSASVKGFGNMVTGTVSTAQTGTNLTGAFNSNLNNLSSV